MLKYLLSSVKPQPGYQSVTVPAAALKKKKKSRFVVGSSKHTMRKSWKQGLLGGTVIKESVKCPKGENQNDWLTIHTIEIYETMEHCFDLCKDFCTPESCPNMMGRKALYLWSDQKDKKPVSIPARKYIENLIRWTGEQIDDTNIFPLGDTYSKEFLPTVKKIMARVIRVYAHIYFHHWANIKSAGAEKHVNTSLNYYLNFVKEFQLINESDLEDIKPVFEGLD
ncbi:hypothetical protein SAMD00019534_083510, partial [Acytostelium subglobosum LB1]|uniref:hypothetical protein n=1 Tax=Acytostelium subglobosum LB1 TaxID=1410327 RepID=UPI0006449869